MPATTTRSKSASTATDPPPPPPPPSPSALALRVPRTPGTPGRILPKEPPDNTIPKEVVGTSETAAITPLDPTPDPTNAVEAAVGWMNCYKMMEKRVLALEEEGRRTRAEVAGLKDRLDEEKRERGRLEAKLAETMQSAEVNQGSQGETVNEWRKEIEEAEKRVMEKMEEEKKKRRKRCIVFTDSNGRDGTTPSSIKYHMPENKRDDYDVIKVVAYRIEDAKGIVEKGELSVDGAIVVLDCLGNDARDTRQAPKLSPDEHVKKLDELRKKLWEKGAANIVVCSVKPTQRADVSQYADRVHRYLQSMREEDGGHGIHSQVRLKHLRGDGLHLQPRFFYVLQKTYACAILGINVPNPTPLESFTPDHVRLAFRREWPAVRASNMNHGWRR